MPLPLSKVKRVGDYGARWWLCLRCRCCRHVGEIPAKVFVQRYGVRAQLATVVSKVSCRLCQDKHCGCKGKNVEAMVGLKR
jgi:hypothetical protein